MKNRQLAATCAWSGMAGAVVLAGCGERAPEGATLLAASRLYVSPDAEPIDDAAILMLDGKSAAAGPAKDIAAGGAGRLAACDGGTVTAGFQNSHVHFIEAKFADAPARPAAEPRPRAGTRRAKGAPPCSFYLTMK